MKLIHPQSIFINESGIYALIIRGVKHIPKHLREHETVGVLMGGYFTPPKGGISPPLRGVISPPLRGLFHPP